MASREREVKVIILGEDKGASKALHGVEQAAGKLGPTGEAANKVLGMLGSTLGTHLGPAGGIVEKGLKNLPDMFRSATGEGLNMSSMLKGGLVGGAAAAGAALVAFAVKGVGDFQRVTGEVRQLKNIMGSTAEEASGLRNVGAMLGIDTDTLAKGMFKLSVNLEKTKGEFAGVHVETAKNADGTTNLVKTLDNVRSAYQSIHDPQQKNIFLTEAMSKAGMNLRGVLSLNATEMERFKKSGAIITDADLKMSLEYSRAQRELGLAMQSLGVTAGRVVVPALTGIAKAAADGTEWVQRNTDSHAGLGKTLRFLDSIFGESEGRLKKAAGANKEAAAEAEKHAAQGAALKASLHELGIEISDDEEKTGELTEETKKAKAAAEAYKQKIDQMATSVSRASQLMGQATGDLTDEQRKLARSFDESNTKANQLKQGLDILVGVHISAARASIDWEAKIAATSAALAENKRTLDITTEAGRANNSAILDMIQSALAHVDALQREGASSEVVTAAYGDHVQALRNVMHQAGYTDEQIEDLLRKYNLLAAAPDITKNIDIYQTTYIRTYNQGEIARSPGNPGGYTPEFALGLDMGPVPGARNQKVPIIAHGGEYVLTPEQMARLTSAGRGASTTWTAGAAGGEGAGTIVVFEGFGINVGQGFAQGIDRTQPIASDAGRDLAIAALTDAQRASISGAQGFGAHNISASGGYHAYTDPTTGEQYYAEQPNSPGDVRSEASGSSITITIGTLVGSDGMRELAEMLRSEQLRYQRRVPTLGYT